MKSSLTRGYTLIELLVVIIIIALFTAISLSTMNRFTYEKQLQNEIKKMTSILELTKSKTNSADITLCGGDGAFITPKINNFTFQTDPMHKSYRLIPNCKEGYPTPISYQTSAGIEINPSSDSTITFSGIYGKVQCSCFIVKSVPLSRCRYIKVSENAVIDEGSCSDCSVCNKPDPNPDPSLNCMCP